MSIYTVRFSASAERSDMPEYTQGYQAFDSDGHEWARWNQPGYVTVLEKTVRAETGTGAIIKFRKWQNNGKPDSWLMEVT